MTVAARGNLKGACHPLGVASQVMTYGWFGDHTFPWAQIGTLIGVGGRAHALAVKLFEWR